MRSKINECILTEENVMIKINQQKSRSLGQLLLWDKT